MNFIDKINYSNKLISGDFFCNVVNKEGKVIQTISEPNLVVNVSKKILAALLGGNGLPVSVIGFGTGTATPTLIDTGLTDVQYYGITSVSYPDSVEWTQFNWMLGYDQMVGIDISEFGLFTSAYDMFSRKTYTPIPKSADMAFEGRWIIKFFQE